VFGGTIAAVLISYPYDLAKRTLSMLPGVLRAHPERPDVVLERIVDFANKAKRQGVIALEGEADRTGDPFLRAALALAVDGTNARTIRQILDIESTTLREAAEAPAELLETAAGYSPTLGILGAVLGLIHVMESLAEPSKLGAGIAVAFVATVYGVAFANLLLLPLATKLRGRAHQSALGRELIIEGIVALQEGLNPRLIEQKLNGFLAKPRRPVIRRQAA
jgi:chemotaxis protein MotA